MVTGDVNLPVTPDPTSCYNAGDVIAIGTGTNIEYRVIGGVNPTRISVLSGLSNNHSKGDWIRRWEPANILAAPATAGSTAITVNDATGFAPGDTVLVGPDTANSEQLTVESVDLTTNQLTFSTALVNDHNAGEAVVSTTTEAFKVRVNVRDTSDNSVLASGDTIEIPSGMAE